MAKYLLEELKVPITIKDLKLFISQKLHIPLEKIKSIEILKRSIDARKKEHMIYKVYKVIIELSGDYTFFPVKGVRVSKYQESKPLYSFSISKKGIKPVIVGSGPCGLFAALFFAEHSVDGVLLERGCPIEERVKRVEKLWRDGVFDVECNPCFGEGGAGTFSDGKLTTRVRHPFIQWILEKFVEMGAPSEIMVDAKPHVGTDKLREVVKNIRKKLLECGWQVRFNSKVVDLVVNSRSEVEGVILENGELIKADAVLLATGHSARDVYKMLYKRGISMSFKPFAIGVRVEHPQELINKAQYGKWWRHPELPPATYHLTYNRKDIKRGVYTFCMCPGGYVICASSEENTVVTNGMSYYARDSQWANAAVVVTVDERDFGEDVLAGVDFQRKLETLVYEMAGGGYKCITQRVLDFVEKRESVDIPSVSYKPSVVVGNVWDIFPQNLCNLIREALIYFDKKIPGFVSSEGTIFVPETRTSSPVRILRSKDFQSVSHRFLYPCGEGSGYSGGIMSSALDGVKVAHSLLKD